MSLIVALKDGDCVYIGSDSLAAKYGTRHFLVNENNHRIFKPYGIDEAIVGMDGDIVETNIVRYKPLMDKDYLKDNKLTSDYIFNTFVSNYFKELDQVHQVKKKEDIWAMTSDVIFAYRDQIFEIGINGSVVERPIFAAIGVGEDVAFGSLLSTKHIKDPKERILMALRAASMHKVSISKPFYIADTKTCKITLLER